MEYAVNVSNERIYPDRSLEAKACKHDGVRVLGRSVIGVEIEEELETTELSINKGSDYAIKSNVILKQNNNILTAWLIIK